MINKKLKDLAKHREDYALQVVPESFRQWSWISLLGVMLGATTAMFFFVVGGTFVQTYGAKDLLIGMIVAVLGIGSIGFILSLVAAETGLDMDLITSGAGFGYKGAGFTSLIYAFSYVIYFSLEGSVIAGGIHAVMPSLSLWFLYIVIGAVFIPLVWYGITSMNYIMWISLPVYLVILLWSIIKVLHVGSPIDF
jgi:purine-cytosine permease-like protein